MKSSLTAFLLLLSVSAYHATVQQVERNHHPHRIPAGTRTRAVADELNGDYWRQLGQNLLRQEVSRPVINSQAKNIIFFLGDGMSIPTVTAARIYKGQKAGNPGEESELEFDKFPYVALSRTYCVDAQVADSACSATAYLCGVKGNTATIGVDANVANKDCAAMNDPKNHAQSIMHWAQQAGKATGIVTTTRVTHATPAGTYAHTAERDWEADTLVALDGADPNVCDDIAEQLIEREPGNKFKVIMGGGRTNFLPRTVTDPEGSRGRRNDGKNLVDQWIAEHPNSAYVTSRDELLAVDLNQVDSVLGLFASSHLEYFIESADAANPTLEEMTKSAITLLQKDTNGFILLVEGGRIDQAHHDGRAKAALEEAVQFDNAILAALNMTSRDDTLIIVTADHAHTMTLNGYPVRGNDILGLAEISDIDGLPYTTLSYANGPGYNPGTNGQRPDLSTVDTTADDFLQPATVPLSSESHGGDDVGIFAIGPQAHLFQGSYEQNYIAHVMAYAACIGPGLKFCDGY